MDFAELLKDYSLEVLASTFCCDRELTLKILPSKTGALTVAKDVYVVDQHRF